MAPCRAAACIHLCERLGCSNEDLSFAYLEHSKPFARVGAASDANFSVSHSGEHGLIGFAAGAALEVDMEVRTAGRDFDGIGDRVYGPRERGVLSGLAGEAKAVLFYRLWKLREALIEALRGLLPGSVATRGAASDARGRALGGLSLPASPVRLLLAGESGRAPVRGRECAAPAAGGVGRA